jgi:hypothetical protein
VGLVENAEILVAESNAPEAIGAAAHSDTTH